MTLRPGMYDEGLMLTGAMRVAAGQIPHRDFYFVYGPAEVYLLAGLFKVFGASLLVERLFDLILKAATIAVAYAFALSHTSRAIALFVAATALLWLFGEIAFGLTVTPVSLLNLLSSGTVAAAFTRCSSHVNRKQLGLAGALAGVAFLFRFDTGIALLGVHALAVAMATRLRGFGAAFGPYLAWFAAVAVPPALYYLAVAPPHLLWHDLVLYPSNYYPRYRSLPFPPFRWNALEDLGVYTPVATAVVACAAVAGKRLPPQRRRFLAIFGLLMTAMYFKGLVRVSPGQLHLAIIPSFW